MMIARTSTGGNDQAVADLEDVVNRMGRLDLEEVLERTALRGAERQAAERLIEIATALIMVWLNGKT